MTELPKKIQEKYFILKKHLQQTCNRHEFSDDFWWFKYWSGTLKAIKVVFMRVKDRFLEKLRSYGLFGTIARVVRLCKRKILSN